MIDIELAKMFNENSKKLKHYEELENAINIVSGYTLEEIYSIMCKGYCLYKSDGCISLNDLEVFGE